MCNDENKSEPHSHSVRFYKYKEELYTNLRQYVAEGISAGETVVLISDHSTCACLHDLPDGGLESIKAERDGKLFFFDSEAMLAMFMNNGKPNEFLFERVMKKLLSQVPKGGKLRAYGDMVNVLCGKMQFEAAIELEKLWNSLIERHGFKLFCGYNSQHFSSKNKKHKQHICNEHNSSLS
jgi:hypothetical protein